MTTSIVSVDSTTSKIQVGGSDAFQFKPNGVMESIASMNGGQLAGLRNRIINGGGLVQQRPSPTLSAVYQYGAVDRFFAAALNGTGVSGNVSLAGGQPTSTTIGYGITAGSWTNGQASIIQRIERLNVIDLASKTVTISGKIYHDFGTATNFTVNVSSANSADNFGAITTVGTSSNISVPSATWTPFTYTLALNAASANGIHVQVLQVSTNTVVSKAVLLGDMQLEVGSTATTFEQRPYGMELALCQRYLPSIKSTSVGHGIGIGGNVTATTAYAYVPFSVPARVPPTGISGASVTTPSQITVSGVAGATASAIGLSVPGFHGANLSLTTSPSTASVGIVFFNNTAGQINFDGCEL